MKEITINEDFTWDNEKWRILSLYAYKDEMILDICKFFDLRILQRFHEKWGKYRYEIDKLSKKQYDELCEDRLLFSEDFSVRLNINDIAFRESSQSCEMFDPVYTEDNDENILQMTAHYGLSDELPWVVWHCRVHFDGLNPAEFENAVMKITLIPDEAEVYGEPLNITAPGQAFTVMNPVTKEKYHLQIKDLEWESPDFLKEKKQKYILGISYIIEPDIDDENFTLSDYSGGDGENQPAMMFYGVETAQDRDTEKLHTACSYLYCRPREDLTWKPKFLAKLKDEITVAVSLSLSLQG